VDDSRDLVNGKFGRVNGKNTSCGMEFKISGMNRFNEEGKKVRINY
jgi:hypothetical protein